MIMRLEQVWGLAVRSLPRAVPVICSVVLLIHLGLRVALIPQYRSDMGGIEHNVIHGIQKLLLGITFYQDPEQPPFDVIQYTPAYHALCATLAHALGIKGLDVRDVFLLSRIVSLLLTIGTALVIYRMALRLNAPAWVAFLTAAVTFCSYFEQVYSRPDSLQSFASLAGLSFFLAWLRDQRTRNIAAAACLMALGCLAKQSGILLLTLPVVVILAIGDRKALLRYITVAGLVLVLSLAPFLLQSGWTIVIKNVVQGVSNGTSLLMWSILFEPATYKYYIGWHILLVLLVIQSIRMKDRPLRALAFMAPCAVLFGLLTGLKSGSWLNYLHEGLALTYLGVAGLIGARAMQRHTPMLMLAFSFLGLLYMSYRTSSLLTWYRKGLPDQENRETYERDQRIAKYLVDEVLHTPDDLALVNYRDYLEHFLVGHSALTQKDVIRYSSRPSFDYGNVHRSLTDGTIRYVVNNSATADFTLLDSAYTGSILRVIEGHAILVMEPRP